MVVHVSRPTHKLLLFGDPKKERQGKREKKETDREEEGRRGGAEGYKWSWTTEGHGNDLWLIVVTDRHAA